MHDTHPRFYTQNKIIPHYHQVKICLGITLIELMVGIAITSVLTTMSLPSVNNFVVQLRVDNEISHLGRLLLTARSYAISSENNVIICPLNNSGACSTNWYEELSVFIDSNANQQFDSVAGELLITTKSAIKSGDTLKYATNRNKITYQATGHLFGLSNGTLRYCPKGYEHKSRAIVVARSGRFYATSDMNADGKDETRSNQNIICD